MIKIRQSTTIMIGGLEELKTVDMQKVFVVTDPFLLTMPALDILKSALATKEFEIFSDIQPDPPIEQVARGVEKMLNFKPDTILAIGGGSAIDAAKAMKYFYSKIAADLSIQLIAVPTTSGTGSEVTNFSIITDAKRGVKYPLVTEDILPDIALLDKELVKSVPANVTADTGMDVLTHCLEAYVSINANDFSNLYAEKAFRFVFKYLPICFKDPKNDEAREKMHVASTLAGLAFNIAGLGLNHGIAHAAGARFHVPHGRMNTILMPEIIAFNAGLDGLGSPGTAHAAERYAMLAHMIGVESHQPKSAVNGLIREIKKLRNTLEMPGSLSEFGLNRNEVLAQLKETAVAALADATTSTNPRVASETEIEAIIKKIV
jgi:alcohol dehydrogenase class IV